MIIIITYCPYCSFIVLIIVFVRLINKIICPTYKFLYCFLVPWDKVSDREKVFTRLLVGDRLLGLIDLIDELSLELYCQIVRVDMERYGKK